MLMDEHVSFTIAKSLEEPFRSHFPKSVEEANAWLPHEERIALSSRVLVVATTRIECTWSAYCDSVIGHNHSEEWQEVLRHGDKLIEEIARAIFPHFKDVPYAR